VIDSGGFELTARWRLDDISAPALGRPRADLVRGTYRWADVGTLLEEFDSKSRSEVCMSRHRDGDCAWQYEAVLLVVILKSDKNNKALK
jgi:hypothetical protein